MKGYTVEFFSYGINKTIAYMGSLPRLIKDDVALTRQVGLVVSEPAKNESDDWFVVVSLEDGTFCSIDVCCLRMV